MAWVSDVVTAQSVTLPALTYSADDVLVLSVMHRSALTVPQGWTLDHTQGPMAEDTTGQMTSILHRRMSEEGSMVQEVVQADNARLAAAILNVPECSGVVERPDLCFSVTGSNPVSPAKGTEWAVMWAASDNLWSSSSFDPWTSNPPMFSAPWPTATLADAPRLGVFLDVQDSAPRTFTTPAPNGYMNITAVELVGVKRNWTAVSALTTAFPHTTGVTVGGGGTVAPQVPQSGRGYPRT